MSERNHQDVGAYYDQEPIAMAEVTGAGLIWFMGRDHLSPPLSNEDHFALDSSHWREASSIRIINLARRMGVLPNDKILELGCGIGGPGRDIVETTNATVYGLSVSLNQLRNLRSISEQANSPYADAIKGDMQRIPFRSETIDHVYSINAIYHVNDPLAVIQETHRVLRKDGLSGVDDWFVTNQTSPEQLGELRHNWSTSSRGFHNFDQFVMSMESCGFTIVDVMDHTAEAAKFLTEERFGTTYDDQVAPILEDAFPKLYQYPDYEPEHAKMAVRQLRADVLYMGQLYRSGDAVSIVKLLVKSKTYSTQYYSHCESICLMLT